MTATFRRPFLVWVLLLLLSLISFGTQQSGSRTAATVILSLAFTKSLLLLWHLMELRHAHVLWRITMITFMFILVGIVLALH